jgi:single-stranded DNA-binding protein
VSTATLVVALAAPPVDALANDKQVLEVFAATSGSDQIPVLLRCSADSHAAQGLKSKTTGDYLIVAGDLFLEGDQAVLYCRTYCDTTAEAYVNEVTVVGRLASEARVAESNKSASRSLAVNRRAKGEDVTDWFKIRGYGYLMEKLINTPKGSLVMVAGSLDQRTNREGNPYVEIKGRTIRVHERGKGSGKRNIAGNTKAVGYDHESFVNAGSDMPTEWND